MEATEHLVQPLQERSRRTLSAIVEATQELMERGDFESASIAEIVAKAGTSVGAFYVRFKTKEALFQHLSSLFVHDVEARMDDVLGQAAAPLETLIEQLLLATAEEYVRHRGFLKSLFGRARLAASQPHLANAQDYNERIYRRIESELIARMRAENLRPKRATFQLGFTMVTATLRELLVFGDAELSPGPRELRKLSTELTRAFTAYMEASR